MAVARAIAARSLGIVVRVVVRLVHVLRAAVRRRGVRERNDAREGERIRARQWSKRITCARGWEASAHATPASSSCTIAPLVPSKAMVTGPAGVDTVTGVAHAEGAITVRPAVAGIKGARAAQGDVMLAARG